MKRISSLILAAAFVFGSMGAAQAIDTKVKGTWDFTFGWGVHTKFKSNKHNNRDNKDYFHAKQGVTTQINFIASENLQAVLALYIGDLNWGSNNNNNGKVGDGSGAGIDADGINIKTRLAYLDWLIPNTGVSVRMGIQHIALPMATGYNNPIFGARSAGISTSYTFDDTFAVTAFWARPFYDDTKTGLDSSNKTDLFGLALPVSLDGITLTPWGAYARIGNQSGAFGYINNGNTTSVSATNKQTAEAWWAGLGINVDLFDPLTFAVDAMYGQLNRTDTGINGTRLGASGWFVTSTLDYKLDWGTPGLFGWWSTGDSNSKLNKQRLGRMPVIGLDDGFNPTSFGMGGNVSMGEDNILTQSGQGTWGVGLQIADMSFIEDLTHTVRVAYITGTNSANTATKIKLNDENVYLTTKDYAIEVDLNSTYQIYENLAATLDLGYINLKKDKNTWTDHKTDDAWKAQVNLKYDF